MMLRAQALCENTSLCKTEPDVEDKKDVLHVYWPFCDKTNAQIIGEVIK